MNAALLLVDAQRDYFERSGLTPTADAAISAMARLLSAFRAGGRPVLHSHTLVAADGTDAMPHWRASGRVWCRAGTPGAQPPEALLPLEVEPLFAKRFFSPFEDPALREALQNERVGRLVVAGLYTHACVRSAVIDAYAHGLEVLLPVDAVASCEPAHAAMTIELLNGRAARCLSTDTILQLLGDSRP
jgi:aldehyde dehydrogenase (NAD+)